MSMLQPPADFSEHLRETRETGAAHVPDVLTPEGEHDLLRALEGAPFEPAPEQEGRVRQRYDLLVVRPAALPGPRLLPLGRLAQQYALRLRDCEREPGLDWLAGFEPTSVYVQRYPPGPDEGISEHRDVSRFARLISVFSLGAPAEFRLFAERGGPPVRRFDLRSGDLVLLRAPLSPDERGVRPLHAVSSPREGVRYSVTIRMERDDAE
jgi:alkylated DNA repair dioxygenase AlkB